MENSIKVTNTDINHVVNYQHKMMNSEAAEYLGISPNTLNVWRSKKNFAIAYYKVGRRVYYAQSDLDAFLLSRRQAM